jgi:Raf kinase inhibitor-like YbhB/YbcL family protein
MNIYMLHFGGEGRFNMEFKICSSAFTSGGYLPSWYSSTGLNASPPFGWACEPAGTRSLALVCTSSRGFVHWILWNIPNRTKTVYGRLPSERNLPAGMHQGVNDLLGTGWTGPMEKLPDLSLTFKLYALDDWLDTTDSEVTASKLKSFMDGHILGEATVTCAYS